MSALPASANRIRVQNILDQLRRDAIIHMYLQSGSAHYNNVLNNCLVLPNIVIGGVVSVSIFSTSSTTWKVTSGVLAIASTVLSSLARQTKAAEQAQLHCSVVKRYSEIIRRIDILYQKPGAVTDAVINEVRRDLDQLMTVQPGPSIYAKWAFSRNFGNVDRVMYPMLQSMALHRVQTIENNDWQRFNGYLLTPRAQSPTQLERSPAQRENVYIPAVQLESVYTHRSASEPGTTQERT